MTDQIKKPVWQILKETKMNFETYAIIAVDGDDAVYMFSGEGDILLELIPGLEKQIQSKIETDKLH